MKYGIAIFISLLLVFAIILEPWFILILEPVAVYLFNILASLVFLIIIFSLLSGFKKRESEKEVVYLAAHQLSAPLSSMKWFFEMLLNGDFGEINEEQREGATQVLEKNNHLIYLVKDLLDAAKFSNGKFIINSKPCDIKDVVSSVSRFFKDEIEKKKIEFRFPESSERLPKIMADEIKIKLAIQNLFDNAIKYTPAGGKIEVSLKNRGKYIEFKIQDSGIGIAKKQKSMIFNKFFRGSNAEKQDPAGHGLGLFFVKNIAASHGGKTWFESRENEGSSFYFTLPIRR